MSKYAQKKAKQLKEQTQEQVITDAVDKAACAAGVSKLRYVHNGRSYIRIGSRGVGITRPVVVKGKVVAVFGVAWGDTMFWRHATSEGT
jgi:hypothetical protein